MKPTKLALLLCTIAVCSGLVGFAFAQTVLQKGISQAREDLDMNAGRLNQDLARITGELKSMVEARSVSLDQEEGLRREIEAKAAAVMLGLETSIIRTHGGILEKTVYAENIEAEAYGRLVEFFGVSGTLVGSLKDKGVSIGSMVVGFGIGKAAQKEAGDIFRQYEQKKSWAEIAQSANLKPGDLLRALAGLVPHEG